MRVLLNRLPTFAFGFIALTQAISSNLNDSNYVMSLPTRKNAEIGNVHTLLDQLYNQVFICNQAINCTLALSNPIDTDIRQQLELIRTLFYDINLQLKEALSVVVITELDAKNVAELATKLVADLGNTLSVVDSRMSSSCHGLIISIAGQLQVVLMTLDRVINGVLAAVQINLGTIRVTAPAIGAGLLGVLGKVGVFICVSRYIPIF